jgi:zinc ribbon protein
MFCPSCGVALPQPTKFCVRCGSQLSVTKKDPAFKSIENRLRDEMVDLFWLTVIGLGMILGGMALIKGQGLGDWILIAYMILSTTAFAINFGLSLWQIRRLNSFSKEARGAAQIIPPGANELNPTKARTPLEFAPSVTENTTRELEPMPKEQNT